MSYNNSYALRLQAVHSPPSATDVKNV